MDLRACWMDNRYSLIEMDNLAMDTKVLGQRWTRMDKSCPSDQNMDSSSEQSCPWTCWMDKRYRLIEMDNLAMDTKVLGYLTGWMDNDGPGWTRVVHRTKTWIPQMNQVSNRVHGPAGWTTDTV